MIDRSWSLISCFVFFVFFVFNTSSTPLPHPFNTTTMPPPYPASTRALLLVAALLCPPLPVFLVEGLSTPLLLSTLLSLLGFHIAGVLYSLFHLWPILTGSATANATLYTALPDEEDPPQLQQPSQQPLEEHQPALFQPAPGPEASSQDPPPYTDSPTTPAAVAAARLDNKIQH